MNMKAALDFLNRLELNNNRDWFDKNKSEFKEIQTQFKNQFQTVYELMKMHDEVDESKIFRIYRDVRFSKNKLPYKIHLSGSFHRKKPQLRGGYYIHIQPNNKSFIGAGFWNPEKEDLKRIRKEFEINDSEMREISSNKKFKSIWGELQGDELKTAPRDFNKSHKAIDLIKKKQYIFTKKITDKEVLSKDFETKINTYFKAIRPYFDYMSDVLTTNLNGESIV